jgi:hypothetical protein
MSGQSWARLPRSPAFSGPSLNSVYSTDAGGRVGGLPTKGDSIYCHRGTNRAGLRASEAGID